MRAAAISILVASLAGCAVYYGYRLDERYGPADPARYDRPSPAQPDLDYWRDVKPVLDSRCVVCHGCYDAPCQLLLTSSAGALRGATKIPVYDSSRLDAAPPTRLGVDATTVEEWRAKGFFSVTDSPESLLLRMLALGRGHPLAEGKRLPGLVKLDIGRPLTCAAGDGFEEYAKSQPLGGMPYGTAPLADAELTVLATWVTEGATAPPPPAVPAVATAQVARWEAFLNGDSL